MNDHLTSDSVTTESLASKHTPGPWSIRTHGHGFIDIVADVQVVEGVTTWQGIATMDESDDQARRDAALIAAAPELLEALRGAVGWIETSPEGEAATRVAFAAIAKATGA